MYFLVQSKPEMVNVANAKYGNGCHNNVYHTWSHKRMVQQILTNDGCSRPIEVHSSYV